MSGRYLRIAECEDDIDLRTISARTTFLRRLDRRYKLKDLDVVCFTNKARTRFRLVMKMRTLLMMCVPEIDDQTKHSTYLRVNETLARLGGLKSAIVKLDELSTFTKARIERIKKIKQGRPKKMRKKTPKKKRK
jgi:hypothetical protein